MLCACWLLLASLCFALVTALLPWSPGNALLVNSNNNTEFAYSYPRRLYSTFTVEMWLRGYAESEVSFTPFSIAHPDDDNVLVVSDGLKLFSVEILPTPPCPSTRWCHLAVAVDLTAYPSYSVQMFVDAQLVGNTTGEFTGGLTPADIETEALGFVFGQEQDSMLGTFDPTQIYSGLLDEFRVWNVTRTAADIQQDYLSSLIAPFPSNLVSYYTFDNAQWNATFYEDVLDGSEQHRIYVADYAGTLTAATLPPDYAPPVTPLERLSLSFAPVCSAVAGASLPVMRAVPGGEVGVLVATLYCGAAGSTVAATVTAVSGGTVSVRGRSALLVSLASTDTITFRADSSGVVEGAGFNFTVTDGSTTIAGCVGVLANSAPSLAAQMEFVTDEDLVVKSWITVTDDDRDVVGVRVLAPPSRGDALMDGMINRTLRYTPPANANGYNIGVFWLQAVDQWGAVSSTMLINTSFVPTPDPPQLSVNTTFTIYRGQRIAIPFGMVDVDGNDPFLIVSDWPSSSQGHLEGVDEGRDWDINDLSISSKFEWASGFGNYSSQYYPGNPYEDSYGIWRLLGPPDCLDGYEDCYKAWSPATLHGDCINRATHEEALSTFYTEFFEVKFSIPVYLTNVILVEVFGGDRVSRVRVPSDRDPSKWKTIMERDIANTPASPAAHKYSVTSLSVCQVLWPVDRVRVEADTCHRDSFYEVDAVQIRGGVLSSKNVLNTTSKLFFRATPGYTGNATFGLTATSCYGAYDSTSEPLTVTIIVVDTPHVLTVEVNDGWSAIDVGQLDSGPRSGNVMVLELPSEGTLRYGNINAQSVLEDLGATSTMFQYQPFRCTSGLEDSFIIQLGPTAVVQVNIQGCTTIMSMLIAIVVPCVVGPVVLGVVFLLWGRHRRTQRDNSKAPRDPNRDICVLFTDIQASTTLWAEVPEVMAPALDVHHTIIRKLIRKYRCYEVKTIGDSFMVACADPIAGVQLSLAIQEALYQHDWESDDLDKVYRRQTDCHLSHDAYHSCWRGLRVRVGMHYGRAQVTFDETTKGYDYYGTVVNAAARIEGAAHGGQVVMSRDVYDQVANYCSANNVIVNSLGAVQLRGLSNPLDLIQVLSAHFGDRIFPPLRTEDHGGEEEKGDLEEPSADGRSVLNYQAELLFPQALDREVLNHHLVKTGAIPPESAVFHAYDVFFSLKSLLNMYKSPAERKKKLREFCNQWHVPCRASTELQENNSLGRLALQLLGPVANQVHGGQKVHSSSLASHTTVEVRQVTLSPRRQRDKPILSPSAARFPMRSPSSVLSQ